MRHLIDVTGDISAILGAAYEALLHARLERRAGARGKVHARAFMAFVGMVREMIETAAEYDTEAVWVMAIAELDRDRGEIEIGVLADGAVIDMEHEWAAFVGCVERSSLVDSDDDAGGSAG